MNYTTHQRTALVRFSGSALLMAGMVVSLLTIPTLSFAETFNRQLSVGMSGSDVRELQSFLAGDDSIYPQGRITGYFGFLTKAAVSNFQERNDLPPVGRVGPATLAVLNLQVDGGIESGVDITDQGSATITSVATTTGSGSATVSWTTSKPTKGLIYYSTSKQTLGEHENSVDISGPSIRNDQEYRSSQTLTIPNLQPNTMYYYVVYTTSQSGGVSITVPSTFRTSS